MTIKKVGWHFKESWRSAYWHFYRKGAAICNPNNYCLDIDKLREEPKLKDGHVICPKCSAKLEKEKNG